MERVGKSIAVSEKGKRTVQEIGGKSYGGVHPDGKQHTQAPAGLREEDFG